MRWIRSRGIRVPNTNVEIKVTNPRRAACVNDGLPVRPSYFAVARMKSSGIKWFATVTAVAEANAAETVICRSRDGGWRTS